MVFRRRKPSARFTHAALQHALDLWPLDSPLQQVAREGRIFELVLDAGQMPPGFLWPNKFIRTRPSEWGAPALTAVVTTLRSTAMDATPHVSSLQNELHRLTRAHAQQITPLWSAYSMTLLLCCLSVGHEAMVREPDLREHVEVQLDEKRDYVLWEPLLPRSSQWMAESIQLGMDRHEYEFALGVNILSSPPRTWDPNSPADVLAIAWEYMELEAIGIVQELQGEPLPPSPRLAREKDREND